MQRVSPRFDEARQFAGPETRQNPQGGRCALTYKMFGVYDSARESVLKIQKQLMTDSQMGVLEVNNQLSQFLRSLRDDQVSTTKFFTLELQQRANQVKEVQKRMAECGLDQAQVSYILQHSNVKPQNGTSNGQVTLESKLMQVLAGLNLPDSQNLGRQNPEDICQNIIFSISSRSGEAEQQLRRLQDSFNKVTAENQGLRSEISSLVAREKVQVSQMKEWVSVEEKSEQAKIGIMSHEYESKIQRIIQDDKQNEMSMENQIAVLRQANQNLLQELQVMRNQQTDLAPTNQFSNLQQVLADRDGQIERLNLEVHELRTSANQIGTSHQEIHHLRTLVKEREAEILELSNQIHNSGRSFMEALERQAQLDRVIVEREKQNQLLVDEVQGLRLEIQALTSRPHTGEREQIRAQLSEVTAQELRERIVITEKIDEKNRLIDLMQEDITHLKQQIESLNNELNRRLTDLERLKVDLSEINLKYQQVIDENAQFRARDLVSVSHLQPSVQTQVTTQEITSDTSEVDHLRHRVSELENLNRIMIEERTTPAPSEQDKNREDHEKYIEKIRLLEGEVVQLNSIIRRINDQGVSKVHHSPEVKRLEGEVAHLHFMISEIQGENSELKQRIQTISKQSTEQINLLNVQLQQSESLRTSLQQTVQELNQKNASLQGQLVDSESRYQANTSGYVEKISELNIRISELEKSKLPSTPIHKQAAPVETTQQISHLVHQVDRVRELQKEPKTPDNKREFSSLLEKIAEMSSQLSTTKNMTADVSKELHHITDLVRKVNSSEPGKVQDQSKQIEELAQTVEKLRKELKVERSHEHQNVDLLKRVHILESQNRELSNLLKNMSQQQVPSPMFNQLSVYQSYPGTPQAMSPANPHGFSHFNFGPHGPLPHGHNPQAAHPMQYGQMQASSPYTYGPNQIVHPPMSHQHAQNTHPGKGIHSHAGAHQGSGSVSPLNLHHPELHPYSNQMRPMEGAFRHSDIPNSAPAMEQLNHLNQQLLELRQKERYLEDTNRTQQAEVEQLKLRLGEVRRRAELADELEKKVRDLSRERKELSHKFQKLKEDKQKSTEITSQRPEDKDGHIQQISMLKSRINELELEVKGLTLQLESISPARAEISPMEAAVFEQLEQKIIVLVEEIGRLIVLRREGVKPETQLNYSAHIKRVEELCHEITAIQGMPYVLSEIIVKLQELLLQLTDQYQDEGTNIHGLSPTKMNETNPVEEIEKLVVRLQDLVKQKPASVVPYLRSFTFSGSENSPVNPKTPERGMVGQESPDQLKEVVRKQEETIREKERQIHEYKDRIHNLEKKISHLEQSVFNGNTQHHLNYSQPSFNMPQYGMNMPQSDIQYYMSEISRLRELVQQFEARSRQQQASLQQYMEQIGHMNRGMYEMEQDRVALQQQNQQLVEKLAIASRRVHELGANAPSRGPGADMLPRAALKAENQIYLNQIALLTKKLNDSEERLKDQASRLAQTQKEEAEHQQHINHLERRIKALEVEEKDSENHTFQKKQELELYRKLYQEASDRLEELIEERASLEAEKVRKETADVSQVSEDLRKELVHLASLTKKVKELEKLPHGVPQAEVQRHLSMIKELIKRVSIAENKLRSQTGRLTASQNEEASLLSQILMLNQRIKQLEKGGSDKDRDQKITDFKKMLGDNIHRLETVVALNRRLEEENKKDIQFIGKSLDGANKHIVQIGVMAQLAKDMERVPRGAPLNELNKYLHTVSEITTKLSTVENILKSQLTRLSKLASQEKQDQHLLVELSKSMLELEKDDIKSPRTKSDQGKASRIKLDELIRKMSLKLNLKKEDSHEYKKEELTSSRLTPGRANKFDMWNSQQYVQETATLQKTISDLQRQAQKDMETIRNLSSQLKERENQLKEKEAQANALRMDEQVLFDQLDAVAKKIVSLEKEEQKGDIFTLEKKLELKQYHDLYLQTRQKLNEVMLKNSKMEEDLKKQAYQLEKAKRNSNKEINELNQRIIELETVPKGVPQDEVQKYLKKISELAELLNKAEEKYQEQSERLSLMQQEEKEHVSLIMVLNNRINILEAIETSEHVDTVEKEQELQRLRTMQHETTDKLYELTEKNKELENLHRKDIEAINQALAEANTNLQQVHMITQRVHQAETESRGSPKEEVTKYLNTIRELTDKLTQSENERMESTRKLGITENLEREHQQQIVELTQRIKELEQQDALLKDQSREVDHELVRKMEVIKGQRDAVFIKLHTQIEMNKSLQSQRKAAEQLVSQSQQEKEKYVTQIDGLQRRISELDRKPNGIPQEEVDMLMTRMTAQTNRITELENINNTLSEKLEKSNSEIKRLEGVISGQGEGPQDKKLLQEVSPIQQDLHSSAEETVYLRQKIDELMSKVKTLEENKGVPQEEVEKYLRRIEELTGRVHHLEARLSAKDRQAKALSTSQKELISSVNTLQHRIKELEHEERSQENFIVRKKQELEQLRGLHKETSERLQQTVMMNHALEEENYKETEELFRLSTIAGSQLGEIAELRKQLEGLKNIPKGVPQEEIQGKLQEISDLTSKLTEYETTARSQADNLSDLQKEEQRHLDLVIVLSEKLKALEREERFEEEYITERNREIEGYKEALNDTVERLQKISEKNRHLEELHKKDNQKISQALARANTLLLTVGMLAKKNKDTETDHVSKYIDRINQLTERLTLSETVIREKAERLGIVETRDRQLQEEIVGLNQRIRELEAEEKNIAGAAGRQSQELRETRNRLEEAIKQSKAQAEQNAVLQRARLEDQKHLKTFEEETRRYMEQLSKMNRRIRELETAPKGVPHGDVAKYLDQIQTLTARLQEVEDQLKEEERTSSIVQKERLAESNHVDILLKKIHELEDKRISTDDFVKQDKEIQFYRSLLSDINKKLERVATKIHVPLFESQIIEQFPERILKQVSIHLKNLRSLENAPQGIPKAEVDKQISLVYNLSDQLEEAEEKLRTQSTRIAELQTEQEKQVNQIIFLTESLRSLESEEHHEEEYIAKNHEKFLKLKHLLDDTTKRLVANIEENNQLRKLNRMEMQEIQNRMAEGGKRLMHIAVLSEKVHDLEAHQGTLPSQVQAYLQTITELSQRLQESEDRFQKEVEMLEEAEQRDKQHQEQIIALTSRINELESAIDGPELTDIQMKADVKSMRNLLDDTMKRLQAQIETNKKLELSLKRESAEIMTRIDNERKLNSKIEALKIKLGQLEEQCHIYALRLGETPRDEVEARGKVETLQEKIRQIQSEQENSLDFGPDRESELNMYKAMLDDYRGNMDQLALKNKKLQEKLIREGQELSKSNHRAHEHNLQMATLKKRIRELESIPRGVSVEEFQARLNEINFLTQNVADLDAELRNQRFAVGEKTRQIDTLNNRIAHLEKTIIERDSALKDCYRRLDEMAVRIKQFESGSAQVQNNNIQSYISQINILTTRVRELENQSRTPNPMWQSYPQIMPQSSTHPWIDQTNLLTRKLMEADQAIMHYKTLTTENMDKIDKLTQRMNEASPVIRQKANLEQQVRALEQENSRLRDQLHKVEGESRAKVVQTESANNNLKAQVERLTRANQSLEVEIEKLKHHLSMFIHLEEASIHPGGETLGQAKDVEMPPLVNALGGGGRFIQGRLVESFVTGQPDISVRESIVNPAMLRYGSMESELESRPFFPISHGTTTTYSQFPSTHLRHSEVLGQSYDKSSKGKDQQVPEDDRESRP